MEMWFQDTKTPNLIMSRLWFIIRRHIFLPQAILNLFPGKKCS